MPFKLKYNSRIKKFDIEKWLDDDSVIENEELQNLRQVLPIEREITIIREFLISKFGNQLPSEYLAQLEQFELRKSDRKIEAQKYKDKKVPLDPNELSNVSAAKLRAFFELVGMVIPAGLTKKELVNYIRSQIKEWPDEENLSAIAKGVAD